MDRIIKILGVLAVILFCLQVFSDNKAELDLWGNVGFVKAFPWDKDFRYTNSYSFTEPDRPWINHEWLSEYIFHRIYFSFGSAGLIFLKILIGLIIAGLLYLAIRASRASGPITFLLLIIAISTMGYGFSTRPHLFTYLLYVIFLTVLWRYNQTSSKYIYLLPPAAFLWVNLHGAFFIGSILLAIFLACEIGACADRRRRGRILTLTSVTFLFMAATFTNPYGWRIWQFIFYSASIPRPFLSEWAPFAKAGYIGEHIDFVVLCAISFTAIISSRKRPAAAGLVLFFIAFLSALALRRNIPLFAITSCFVAGGYLEDAAGATLRRIISKISPLLIASLLFIFCIVCLVYAVTVNKTNFLEIEVDKSSFPLDAVSFIKDNGISGNAVVFFNWSEYCIWHLYPEWKVFMDGRLCSAYSQNVINDYFDFLYQRDGSEKAIRDYPADIVLIHKGNPAYLKMLIEPGWFNVYNDGVSGLFLKKGKHKPFFERFQNGDIVYAAPKKEGFFP